MNIQAWPFLVSRNRYLGYQTVVAPNFIVEANIAGLLANQLGGDPSDHPQYKDLPNTKAGDVFAVYWVVRATDASTIFRDESGRPILWIEGVILREPAGNITFSGDVLQEAHRQVEPSYRQFWEQTSEGLVRRSHPFSIHVDRNLVARVASDGYEAPSSQSDQLPALATSAGSSEATRSLARPWSRYATIVLSVLLIASSAWAGALFIQNRQLAAQVQELQATIQALQASPTPQK